jgi:23S rRNA (cytidine1920-2'-O)/16S rRNA (cytidine1409-2'-O)-methyltransferase
VLRNVLAPGANCIFLVKPQFEAGRQNVGKKGVVKDPAVHKMVLRQVLDAVSENGFTPIDLTHSPIRGPEGNIEFLLWFSDIGESKMFNVDEIVRAAHREHAAG